MVVATAGAGVGEPVRDAYLIGWEEGFAAGVQIGKLRERRNRRRRQLLRERALRDAARAEILAGARERAVRRAARLR